MELYHLLLIILYLYFRTLAMDIYQTIILFLYLLECTGLFCVLEILGIFCLGPV